MILLDLDVVCYRAAWSVKEEGSQKAVEKSDELVWVVLNDLLDNPFPQCGIDYMGFLTGVGNFRKSVSPIYKAHRPDPPQYIKDSIKAVRANLIENWGAEVSFGEEADDLISKKAHSLGYDCIVASIDKDFAQLPCRHYNLTTRETIEVDPDYALRFLYAQILAGDDADNIKGIFRVGVKTGLKLLEDSETELDLYNKCVEVYCDKCLMSEEDAKQKVLENGQLVYLRRFDNEMWQPPQER